MKENMKENGICAAITTREVLGKYRTPAKTCGKPIAKNVSILCFNR